MVRFLAVLLLGMCGVAYGQTPKVGFAWEASLGTYLDNLEGQGVYAAPRTLGGVWVAPLVGVRLGERHRIMAGVNYLQEFGRPAFERVPDFLAYYNYSGDIFEGFAGIVPREKMRGYYSYAMFGEQVAYFNHKISGALLQWNFGGRSQHAVELFLDWNTVDAALKRESFMVGSSGDFRFSDVVYGGYNGYYQHYKGGREEPDFLVDNLMYGAMVGGDFSGMTSLDKLFVEAGVVGSWQRARVSVDNVGENRAMMGFNMRAGVQWKGWGLEDAFYVGDALMPLWQSYGARLYWGDSHYASPMYNRAEVYWARSFWERRVAIKIALVLHTTDQGSDFSQLASVLFKIN